MHTSRSLSSTEGVVGAEEKKRCVDDDKLAEERRQALVRTERAPAEDRFLAELTELCRQAEKTCAASGSLGVSALAGASWRWAFCSSDAGD